MKLYLARYDRTKLVYESIESGYDKLIVEREWWHNEESIPKIIMVDYWEIFDEEDEDD